MWESLENEMFDFMKNEYQYDFISDVVDDVMLSSEWYNDTVQALCAASMNMRTISINNINVNIASDDIDYDSEANYNYNSISCGGSDNLWNELMNDKNIAGINSDNGHENSDH